MPEENATGATSAETTAGEQAGAENQTTEAATEAAQATQEATQATPQTATTSAATSEQAQATGQQATQQATQQAAQQTPAEVETLRTQLSTLETENNTLKMEIEGVRLRALELDVRDALSQRKDLRFPSIVADLAIAQSGKLKSAAGKVEGLDELITGLKAKHPNLFFDTPGSADGGAQGATPAGDANAWLRRQLS